MISAAGPVLDDPFAFACEALEICLRRGIDPIAAARSRDEIAKAFFGRRRGIRYPGQFIAASDVQPDAEQTREVILGQVPTLRDLRDGRFMERPDHLAAALSELDRHVTERDWRQEPYIYAFWIEGRSGNGKSVLLLQLMQQIVQKQGAHVIWLDDASEKLLPLLESWAGASADAGPFYVFVDDFYGPNKRKGTGFREIARLLRESNRTDWPVLVTCGPPEQRREWKASGNDEAFRSAHWLLPPARTEEPERLKRWFRNRTREQVKTGAAFAQDQGLMISMMFELRKGEMLEFGRRFRSRLEDLNLVDALTVPLALNRLYVWSPGVWLDESEDDALRQLNQDEDFSILSLSGRPGQYLRITHPHLSDVIYHAVRERDDPIVCARDLHRAFAKSLESDPSTAQLILHRVAEGHERLDALDATQLARGMTKAWREFSPLGRGLTEPDLATVWTNWAVWSAREPVVAQLLADQPLERAREALQPGHLFWGVLWRRLWDCGSGRAGLMADAEAWLTSDHGRQSRDWSFVWEKLFEYKKGTHQDLNTLEGYGASWLQKNEYEPDWNFVLRRLASTNPHRVAWDSALRLIDEFPKDRNWAYVFEVVVDNADIFDRARRENTFHAGSEWLGTFETQDRAEWKYVWQKLAELRCELPKDIREAILRQGYEWLSEREDRAEWAHVWRKLAELRGELPEDIREAILRQGYEWLSEREDRAEWTHVWQKLAELRGELPEDIDREALLRQGYEWLSEREDRAEWAHVWEKLAELRGELPKDIRGTLLRQGYEWLSEREDRAEWNYVWQKLAELRDELPKDIREAMLRQGYEWLSEREDRAEWNYVWQKLAELRDELPKDIREAMLRQGYEWLSEREDRAEWTHVWRKLTELRGELPKDIDREALLRQGYEWLSEREDRDSWSFVWQRLEERRFQSPEGEPTLEELAWRWLQRLENANRGEWDKIWETCFKGAYRDPAFLTAGSDWVLRHGTLPQSNGLAQRLIRDVQKWVDWTPSADLIAWVRNWLAAKANHQHDSWPYLWGLYGPSTDRWTPSAWWPRG